MADMVVKTAKTVEQALQAALAELGTSEENVTYEILDRPSKGLFGLLGGKPARVRVTRKEEIAEEPVKEEESAQEAIHGASEPLEQEEEKPVMEEEPEETQEKLPVWNEEVLQRAEKFLRDIFQAMQMEVEIRPESTEEGYLMNLEGKSLGVLIGKHGQTLDALQYLTNLAANQERSEHRVRIIIDVEGYRARRTETLEKLAHRLADRAIRIRQEIKLEPMNRHERKIIHMALQEHHRVTTYSDGEEPYRYVVIAPGKNKKKQQ